MEVDKQTVADEPEVEAQPSTQDQGAQESEGQSQENLDDILRQFQESQKSQGQTPDAQGIQETPSNLETNPAQSDEVLQRLQALESAEFAKDIDDLTSRVGGETDLPSYAVRGFIDEQSDKDPRIKDIFANRKSDPATYNKMVAGLQRKFADENKTRIDPAATSTDAAVAASLQGSQKTAPETPPPDLTGLSNNEFRQKVQEEWGYTPVV